MRYALLVSMFLVFARSVPGQTHPKATLSCADLRSLTGFEFSVSTAVHSPATAEAPEHCLVTGQVMPEIRFEVSLPVGWNGRFYMFGNGGYAGEPLDAPGR